VSSFLTATAQKGYLVPFKVWICQKQ